MLLNDPFWVIDFLPYQVPADGKGQFFLKVYLSLGDREGRARNTVIAAIADRIRELHVLLTDREVICTLEWNSGTHFKNPDLRNAKSFSWLLDDNLTKKTGKIKKGSDKPSLLN